MRAAGIRGTAHPSLETMRLAEAPPAPVYELVGPRVPRPTADQVANRAEALLRDPTWLAARERLQSQYDTARAAHADAGLLSLTEWELRRPVPMLANAPEYEAGQRAAARWRPVLDALAEILDHADEMIPDLPLAAMPEADLRTMAEEDAKTWREALVVVQAREQRDPTPDERRAICPKATLRRLRDKASTAGQHAAAVFGTVGRGQPYADDYSLARWQERQARGAAFAAGMVLVTSSGRTVSMADVMNSGKKAALARVYTVAMDMDEVAKREGWECAFITLTLPPEYHPNPSAGRCCYDPRLSTRDTDRALSRLVAQLRARMAKAGIPTFGIRVYEPHQDGCPHAHILAYMLRADIDRTDAILQDLRPEPVPGQRIATRCERIDRRRAAPTTYAFKYLAKAMNAPVTGDGDGDDNREDGDHLTNHDRVRAWASERGVRRWGLWGTHGIQRAWQALYTREELPEGTPNQVVQAWRAIRTKRGHGAERVNPLDALGAVRGSGVPRVHLTYENVPTAYGDTRRKAVGLTLDGTDWAMPLKQGDSRVISGTDLAAEQEARVAEATMEARRRAMREWREAWARGERLSHPAVTVVGSCPRAVPAQSPEASPVLRTGPPNPENVDFDDLTID